MQDISNKLEAALGINLPHEYKDFINKIGVISDGGLEIFGYINGIDESSIPCVIAATKLYKNDYPLITEDELVIQFDDYLNKPVLLNINDGSIYSVDEKEKNKINSSFNVWLSNIRDSSK